MIYRSSTLRRYTETRLTQLEVESLHNTSTIQVDARASVIASRLPHVQSKKYPSHVPESLKTKSTRFARISHYLLLQHGE